MTRAHNAYVRFRCPQCISWLQVPRRAAGTRRRCPRCHLVLEVPQESLAPVKTQPYALSDSVLPPQPSPHIGLTCPTCGTRIDAAANQIGQELACPDCGHRTVVPPPKPPPKATSVRPPVEEYPVCEEADEVADWEQRDDPAIRFFCRVCGTMMYARESEIGRELVCPDCRAATVVPKPEQRLMKPPRSPSEIGEYALAAVSGVGSASGPQDYVPVVCSVCHTRLHATAEQVGGRLVCPDCGKRNVIPPPPPAPREVDVMAGADGGYGVSARPSPPPPEVPMRAPVQSGMPLDPHSRRPMLPRRPFVTGTFSFPFTPGTFTRTALLTAWTVTVFFLTPLIPVPLLGAVATVFVAFGAAVTMASAVALVQDTAQGCDVVQHWPGLAIIEWLFDPLYVVIPLCASLLPGAILRWMPGDYGNAIMIVTPPGLFFLFPFLFLSALESGSPVGILSWPVCRSLWRAWKGWASFYLLAAPLLISVYMLWMTTYVLLATARGAAVFYQLLVLPFLVVVAWLIYFRLLGRLAWYCAERDRAVEKAQDEDDLDEQAQEAGEQAV